MLQCGNRQNPDANPFTTFISCFLDMHILTPPPHTHTHTHTHTCLNLYQWRCQTWPLCTDSHPHLLSFRRMKFFTSSRAAQGTGLSEHTWSGFPLLSDGKICFLIQSSLLPPGYATPRQIPAVWLQNLTDLKNSLITIPLKYPVTLTPTGGGNANHVSPWLREAWKQSLQYGGFGLYGEKWGRQRWRNPSYNETHSEKCLFKAASWKIWHILPEETFHKNLI